MTPYEKFGRVYDQMGHDKFSERMAEYTLDILDKFDYRPVDGLDLCCGTGTAIKVFSDRGLTMSGLDRSKPMLATARKKLNNRTVRLYHQELPRFEISLDAKSGRKRLQRFDLVTCFFDSLNYLLTERQLRAAFRAAYRHLKPGGWFVFDMNTVAMFKSLLGKDQPYSGVRKDIAWVLRSEFHKDPQIADFLLTFFVKSGRGWRRFDELHRERAYPDLTVRKMLRKVGFQVKGFYRCFGFKKPAKDSQRFCVAARRPG